MVLACGHLPLGRPDPASLCKNFPDGDGPGMVLWGKKKIALRAGGGCGVLVPCARRSSVWQPAGRALMANEHLREPDELG